MLNGDVARYRTDDLVRAGQEHRANRPIVVRRQAARRALRRRIVTTAAALFSIPVKH